MAQKVNIVLVDDIDGSEATETVSFSLDGNNYEIDLNDANAAALREAMSGYVGHARKVAGGGRAKARRTSGGAASSAGGPSAADIRAWARDNGFELSERGRVPAEVRQAYDSAH